MCVCVCVCVCVCACALCMYTMSALCVCVLCVMPIITFLKVICTRRPICPLVYLVYKHHFMIDILDLNAVIFLSKEERKINLKLNIYSKNHFI